MDFSYKIGGTKQVDKALSVLTAAMRNKALRPAMREGGRIIKSQAVENLKALLSGESSDTLEKSLVVKSLRMRNKNLRIAVAIGNKLSPAGVRVGLYGSVFELGKVNQAPQSYLRSGARQARSRAIDAVTTGARKRLNAAVAAAKVGRP